MIIERRIRAIKEQTFQLDYMEPTGKFIYDLGIKGIFRYNYSNYEGGVLLVQAVTRIILQRITVSTISKCKSDIRKNKRKIQNDDIK